MKQQWVVTSASAIAAIAVCVEFGSVAAIAATPVGTCTESYTPMTFDQLSPSDPALTPALFATIDSNGDGVICFKPYPNGPHGAVGHLGNLVDDKAAPHG